MKSVVRALAGAAILAVVVSAGIGTGVLLNKQTAEQNAAESPAAPGDTPAESAPAAVEGAAIDAPVDTEGGASPAGGAGSGQPFRTISPESLALLEKAKGDSGDGLTFTKTPDGEYFKATFTQLASYEYAMPSRDEVIATLDAGEELEEQIPEPIRDLDGEKVLLVGYMVPIDVTRDGDIKSFALTENQQFCCFGVPPAINEWVMVTMADGDSTQFYNDLPVAAYGRMTVDEEILDGYVMSVYRMEATEVIDVKELLKRSDQSNNS